MYFLKQFCSHLCTFQSSYMFFLSIPSRCWHSVSEKVNAGTIFEIAPITVIFLFALCAPPSLRYQLVEVFIFIVVLCVYSFFFLVFLHGCV